MFLGQWMNEVASLSVERGETIVQVSLIETLIAQRNFGRFFAINITSSLGRSCQVQYEAMPRRRRIQVASNPFEELVGDV